VRCDRDIGDTLEGPVEQVVRDPCATAGAVHVVLALLADNSHIASRIAAWRGDHRQRVAVARRLADLRVRRPGGRGDQGGEGEQSSKRCAAHGNSLRKKRSVLSCDLTTPQHQPRRGLTMANVPHSIAIHLKHAPPLLKPDNVFAKPLSQRSPLHMDRKLGRVASPPIASRSSQSFRIVRCGPRPQSAKYRSGNGERQTQPPRQ
jgi:hypothetical protein